MFQISSISEPKVNVFKARKDRVLLITAMVSFGSLTLVPISAIAASEDQTPQQVPTGVTPTWKNTIEQQQAWQDTIQKQRIESLRQSQQPQMGQESNTNDASPTSQACLSVHRIELGAMLELSKSVQNKLRQQAEQLSSDSQDTKTSQTLAQKQCVTVDSANNLIRSITEAYLEQGYFKIAISPTQTEQGTSIWQIAVAKIIDIDNQTQLPTSRLFGNIVGKPANMAMLDQAVSNGERIMEGPLLVDIYPVGDDVRLKVTQGGEVDKVSADMEWRYDPDDSYGHTQVKLHSTLRNILGQADLTSLTVQQSLKDNYGYDADNQRRSASIYSLIPNGKWQWSGLLAADEYKRTTQLQNSKLEQTGNSWQANLRADYTFDRDQDSISTIYGQLAHQDVTSELLGSQLYIQSPTLSSARIGATHTKLFNKRSKSDPRKFTTGAWVVDLSAEQGIGNHDNPATKQGLSDDYLRWLLSGYLNH